MRNLIFSENPSIKNDGLPNIQSRPSIFIASRILNMYSNHMYVSMILTAKIFRFKLLTQNILLDVINIWRQRMPVFS